MNKFNFKLYIQFIVIIGILISSSNLVNVQEVQSQTLAESELRILKENEIIKGLHPVSSAVCYKDDPIDPLDCQAYNSFISTYLFEYDDVRQVYEPNYDIIEFFSHTTDLSNFVIKIIFKDNLVWSDGVDFHAVNDVLGSWRALQNIDNGGDERFIPVLKGYFFEGGNTLTDSLQYNLQGYDNSIGFRMQIPHAITFDPNLMTYSEAELKYSIYKDLAQFPILPYHLIEEQDDDIDLTALDFVFTSLSPYELDFFANTAGAESINLIRNPYTRSIYKNVVFDEIKILQMTLEDAIAESKDTTKMTILSPDYQIYGSNITTHKSYEIHNLDKNYMLGFSELFDGHIRNHVVDNFNHYTHDNDVSNSTFIQGFKKAFDLSINKTLLAQQLNSIDDPNYYYKGLGSLFNVETDVFYDSNVTENQFNVTLARETFTSIGFDYDSLEASDDQYLGDLGILINNDYFSDDNILSETVLSQLRDNLKISFTTIYDTSDLPNHTDKWEFFNETSKLHNVIDDFYFVTVNVFRAESYNYFQVKNFYNPASTDDNPYNNNLFNQELKDAFINYTAKDNYRSDFLEGAKATIIEADLKHRQNIGLVSNTNSILVSNRLTNYNPNLLSMNAYNYDIDYLNKSSSGGNGGGGGGGSGSSSDNNDLAFFIGGAVIIIILIVHFQRPRSQRYFF